MPLNRHHPRPNQWGSLPVSALLGLLATSDLPDRRGNCYGYGEVMFPAVSVRGGHMLKKARAMCLDCPIARECLDMALGLSDWEDQSGVWAGTVPAERRRMRADRRAA